ncbi:hypothetical protein D9757_014595 [Collybiopsis confluens]|uniref:Chromatin elongation factor spt5 n=1 Tax=Collybiopsis confluens TaxID=2823264 RepID=A0A8H5D8C5_9AGAR|nr:hypothetical protein D9757_014595 [Collybiopsis confluens]
MQDEAGVDGSEEELEESIRLDEEGTRSGDENDDDDQPEKFSADLSNFREYQASKRAPTIFADVIQRIEQSSDCVHSNDSDISQFWIDNQHILHEALYQHPGSSDVTHRHIRGSERRIIKRIQTDIRDLDRTQPDQVQNRFIVDVHPSQMAGHVYLIVLNHPNMVPLWEYLHSFADFIYDHSIINRTSASMPIHKVVTDFLPLSTDPSRISIGDWVEIKGGDVYAGSLGLVVHNDSRLEYSPQDRLTVLTLPRIPRSPVEEESMFETGLGPPPAPLYFADAQQVSNLYTSLDILRWGEDSGRPIWADPLASGCIDHQSCPPDHSRDFFFHGHILQCGLVFLVYRMSDIKRAPTVWDPKIIEIFSSSHHPQVINMRMPIPNSWSFEKNDNVQAIKGFISEHATSTTGVVIEVSDLTCEVSFNGERNVVSKHALIKSFEPGDQVIIPNVGSGTFAMNATDTKAVVFFDERTQSVLTSEKHAETTGLFHLNTLILASSLRADSSFANSTRVDSQAPNPSSPNVNRLRPLIWVGKPVLVTKHPIRNGYRGVITDVQISATSLSGISVWVSYEAINIPREWLDYSQVRNLETLRYLHDARPSGLNDSYRFKKGFYPVYTNIEKYLIQHRDGLTRGETAQKKILENQENDVHQLITLDDPPPDQWILDPRWKLSLGNLEFFVQFHHGDLANGVDHKVFLVLINSRIEVRTREGATSTRNRYRVIPPSDICNVPPGRFCTIGRVSARAFDARGLYLVAFAKGENQKHIGKLVRRIRAGKDLGVYMVQRVRVISKAGRKTFEESLLDDAPFEIHYTSLLLVHMSTSLNNAGNMLMYHIRKQYGVLRLQRTVLNSIPMFDSIASLMRHMRMSTKCHQKIKLTDKGQQRLRKAPRLSEDRDIADALGTDTQSNVEQNVAGPAPARTPSPVPYPPLPPPAPPPPPSLVTLRPTRSGRTRFLPARFQDNLPTLSRSMPSTFQPENPIEEPAPAPVPAPFPSPTPEPDIVLKKVRTDPDQFGIFRIYSELPKSIPDEEVPIEDVCEGAGFPVPPPADSSSIFGSVIKVSSRVKNSIIAPFLNITVWRLMSWWYNSDTKSIADLDRLVKEVIHPSDFDPSHLEGFSTDKVLKDLDNYQDDTRLFPAEDGWREISVEIPVPCRGVKQPEAKAPRYIISGIFIRKPLEVMKSTFQSSLTEKFHYTPFELRQESFPGSPSSFRLHGELYNSPAFIEEHNRVQVEQFKKGKASPENKDLQYPTALAG